MRRGMRARWTQVACVAVVLASGGVGCSGDDGPSEVTADGATAPTATIPSTELVARSFRIVDGDGFDVMGVMRQRVDALGISDAELTFDGDVFTVAVPAGDADLLDVVAQVGDLTFRPVLSVGAPGQALVEQLPDGSTITGVAPPPNPADGEAVPQLDPDTGEVVVEYWLGPVALTGSALDVAGASFSGTGAWVVSPVFAGGSDGIDGFNEIAGACFTQSPVCPTGQLALVLDGVVLSAPSINAPSFERDQIEISGGFDEAGARALAAALSSGPLGARLEPIDG